MHLLNVLRIVSELWLLSMYSFDLKQQLLPSEFN